MTQQTIDELRRLEREATPGPWKAPKDCSSEEISLWGTNVIDHEGCKVWPWHHEEDMTFAYLLRNNAVALLDELESLRNQKRCTCPTHQRGCELMIVRGDRHSPDET